MFTRQFLYFTLGAVTLVVVLVIWCGLRAWRSAVLPREDLRMRDQHNAARRRALVAAQERLATDFKNRREHFAELERRR